MVVGACPEKVHDALERSGLVEVYVAVGEDLEVSGELQFGEARDVRYNVLPRPFRKRLEQRVDLTRTDVPKHLLDLVRRVGQIRVLEHYEELPEMA
jgi:hypothetical protein